MELNEDESTAAVRQFTSSLVQRVLENVIKHFPQEPPAPISSDYDENESDEQNGGVEEIEEQLDALRNIRKEIRAAFGHVLSSLPEENFDEDAASMSSSIFIQPVEQVHPGFEDLDDFRVSPSAFDLESMELSYGLNGAGSKHWSSLQPLVDVHLHRPVFKQEEPAGPKRNEKTQLKHLKTPSNLLKSPSTSNSSSFSVPPSTSSSVSSVSSLNGRKPKSSPESAAQGKRREAEKKVSEVAKVDKRKLVVTKSKLTPAEAKLEKQKELVEKEKERDKEREKEKELEKEKEKEREAQQAFNGVATSFSKLMGALVTPALPSSRPISPASDASLGSSPPSNVSSPPADPHLTGYFSNPHSVYSESLHTPPHMRWPVGPRSPMKHTESFSSSPAPYHSLHHSLSHPAPFAPPYPHGQTYAPSPPYAPHSHMASPSAPPPHSESPGQLVSQKAFNRAKQVQQQSQNGPSAAGLQNLITREQVHRQKGYIR
eukprot:GILI01007700.1.p1 GENE.GILI01007700.1~~GILI01007700.1.p1  ORF type:complete len:486 (-),score=58.36 GILI01007700.1:106-1563(-)